MHVSRLSDLLIFDLDGTLADTIEDIASSVNRTLAEFNFDVHGIDAYKLMVGNGFRNLVEKAIPRQHAGDQALIQQVLDVAVRDYAVHCLERTKPFPRMPEVLEELSRNGCKLAVLSNKPDSMSKLMVRELFGTRDFVAVWGNSPERPRKPDPSAAIDICLMAGIAPARAAFIGDSGVDMQTAKTAGMTAIGVLYGYRSRDELVGSGADYLIEAPIDLVSLIISP